jgi:hypothetical protein
LSGEGEVVGVGCVVSLIVSDSFVNVAARHLAQNGSTAVF